MDAHSIERIVKEVLAELQTNPNDDKSESDLEEIIFTSENKVSVANPHNIEILKRAQTLTPARIGIGRTGTRMKTYDFLKFRVDHATAQDAIWKDVSDQFLKQVGLPLIMTQASSKEEYLMNLNSGRELSEESVEWILKYCPRNKQVQILVCDGLSSIAVEENIPDLLPSLLQGLQMKNISVGQPLFIKRSRVWVQDQVASLVNCDVVVSLIGERPGLATAESLSAYLVYRPSEKTIEADRTVISNIHHGGTPPVEAGAYIADVIAEILRVQASGVKYAQLKAMR
ncbi:ethanolamine ammonia-lyase subunit EutC [Kyrpidia spormannii]|uniref:Ethanolamine ammonia-lyase light chain n=2 Tax=Kyrpidia spormannii TaxID=2055160 RepID=A0ACA8ZC92_9BACL|nr:ethanolamine ammonia-lyase subunit EutC [Kyrpidia spormannii]CAB3394335.1 Ethanolamine ammonia-lyase light chain [Kyrpidia spormannii]CAB3395273.1 Ethanolamine ammonia-lyase light chain [Kyrpidia spormannii]